MTWTAARQSESATRRAPCLGVHSSGDPANCTSSARSTTCVAPATTALPSTAKKPVTSNKTRSTKPLTRQTKQISFRFHHFPIPLLIPLIKLNTAIKHILIRIKAQAVMMSYQTLKMEPNQVLHAIIVVHLMATHL